MQDMIRYTRVLVAFALSALALVVQSEEVGKYLGTVQTEWLPDGRRMRLLAPLVYIDPKGQEWQAAAGSVVDGASIPQFAWSIIGGPFEGKYRSASVIHDVGCDEKTKPWEAVHEAFYWAMRASEVRPFLAKVIFAAVYHFGPRWPRQVEVVTVPCVWSSGKCYVQREFRWVQPPARRLNEDDFEKLKLRIEERESGASGGVSLDDIRAYQPER